MSLVRLPLTNLYLYFIGTEFEGHTWTLTSGTQTPTPLQWPFFNAEGWPNYMKFDILDIIHVCVTVHNKLLLEADWFTLLVYSWWVLQTNTHSKYPPLSMNKMENEKLYKKMKIKKIIKKIKHQMKGSMKWPEGKDSQYYNHYTVISWEELGWSKHILKVFKSIITSLAKIPTFDFIQGGYDGKISVVTHTLLF